MVDTEMLAARMRGEAAWVRLLAAAGRLERALKHNPRWRLQPRVPAGNPGGGRWTDGGGSVVVPASGRASRIARMRRRYPGASLAQITRLEIATMQARTELYKVRRLDPRWSFGERLRGPGINSEIRDLEAVATAARKRFGELTRGAIPEFDPLWGRTRLLEELRNAGYRYKGPADTGQGVIYRNYAQDTEVRIMRRPNREPPLRNTDPGKWLMQYYYRYKVPNRREGRHVPIPDGQ
ncbi:hypothetical protein SAMN05216452_3662 [Nitratireductor aquibiodomus]|uniref:Uncharacterized protein n=1 Tax=Nitratireductor aquibiodomus TaxID=204799 RepID=A0A1H4N8G6_9HYPH|nr:hypothetical protein SAMN05216452_3662 [Nitratireductor aquibiodomus]